MLMRILLFLFICSSAHAFEDTEIDASTIAYHIYLVNMASMPSQKNDYHRCLKFTAKSPFGKSTNEIIASSDDERKKSSLVLANKILSVAKAFNFSSRFDIGYWMGIIHRESLFCLDIVGGGIGLEKLLQKVDSISSATKPPYADLGIGQINYITIKDFINYSFPKYEDAFQLLIDSGYYSDLPIPIRSPEDIRRFFINNFPSSKTKLGTAKAMYKNIFKTLVKYEELNLSLSLPILLDKISLGINVEDVNDKSSRLYKYNKSSTYKKFSTNFTRDFEDLDYVTKHVWKRAFGVLTYNGHRDHALNYAVDVYCIKSLYDSRFYRSKKLAHDFVYREKLSPFYRFFKKEEPSLPNCDRVLYMQSIDSKTVRGEEQPMLTQVDFGGEAPNIAKQEEYDDIYWGGTLPEATVVAKVSDNELADEVYLGLEKKVYKILYVRQSIHETFKKYGTYEDAIEEIGYKGKAYLYSYVRQVLYPKDEYEYEPEIYEFLQKEILRLNPEIKDNIIPESGNLLIPTISVYSFKP